MNQDKSKLGEFNTKLAALLNEYSIDISDVSDGHHSFDELYRHRNQLFVILLKTLHTYARHETVPLWNVWKSQSHFDGTMWNGWFIAGIGNKSGEQITYHLPISLWDELYSIPELEKAPHWDGHTPKDVLKRLAWLI